MEENKKICQAHEYELDFKINENKWKIRMVKSEDLLNEYKATTKDDEGIFCHGLTIYSKQIILLNKDMKKEAIIKTLKHELTHCFIWNNGLYNVPNFTEEMVCDLVSSINNFINNVVNEFKGEY